MTVKEIVTEYLKANGYDGLWCADGGCACIIGDLAPCCGNMDECEPGYRVECDPETCTLGGDCEFHISPVKPDMGDATKELEAEVAEAALLNSDEAVRRTNEQLEVNCGYMIEIVNWLFYGVFDLGFASKGTTWQRRVKAVKHAIKTGKATKKTENAVWCKRWRLLKDMAVVDEDGVRLVQMDEIERKHPIPEDTTDDQE